MNPADVSDIERSGSFYHGMVDTLQEFADDPSSWALAGIFIELRLIRRHMERQADQEHDERINALNLKAQREA